MAKHLVRGLKIRDGLCLVRLRCDPAAMDVLPAFFGLVAGSGINMPFATSTRQSGGLQAACCVDARDLADLEALVNADQKVKTQVSYTPRVGLLSLFPHYSSVILFGQSLHCLSEGNIRILGVASSIGALTFVLHQASLDTAAELLSTRFNLMQIHPPIGSERPGSPAVQCTPSLPE